MGPAISEVLPFAIGVAISPMPIIAVILILFSPRARVNGPLFLAGWGVGLAVVAGVVYGLADAASAGSDSGASDTVSWLKIGLGVALLALARRRWAARSRTADDASMPKWMKAIDAVTPVRAFLAAVLLAGVNPKNAALTIGAAGGVAQLDASTADAAIALAVFVVIASATIAAPVVYAFVGGDDARARLDEAKGWLAEHNSAVMAVLLLVFGVVLIARGLQPLTA
jgi:hypothetical protein